MVVSERVDDLDLSYDRRGLDVVWNERAGVLENASGGIARDGGVILQDDGAAVRQLPNPFRIHGGGEGGVRQRWNENTDEDLARAAIWQTLRLLSRRLRGLSQGN